MTSRQSRRLKKAFLEEFRVLGNVTAAAQAAGIKHRSIIYDWQEHDEQFALAYTQAEAEATEHLEAEARRRAVEGVERTIPVFAYGKVVGERVEQQYSDVLLMFLLKARAPEKYRERVQLQHAGANGEQLDLAALVGLARATVSDADPPG